MQKTVYLYELGIKEDAAIEVNGETIIAKNYNSIPVCDVIETALSKTEIRKYIEDSGQHVKRGVEVYAKKIRKMVYSMKTEDFMKSATLISDEKVNEEE